MIIIAHNIRSLHNVGAILRSADAFDVEKVYLTGFTGQPPRKEIAKVALGSDRRVSWQGREDILTLIEELKQTGYQVLALDNIDRSISLEAVVFEKPIALILGNEVEGLESAVLDACDQIVMITMPGAKQSLNVSVAAGIAMFALSTKNR